jgi:hypothetical protein
MTSKNFKILSRQICLSKMLSISLISATLFGCGGGGSGSTSATSSAPSVTSIVPGSALLGENVQITVTGLNLPSSSTLEIADMMCQLPLGGTATTFSVRCIAGAVGVKPIRVVTAVGGLLIDASKTITISPPSNQVVTRSVLSLVGPSSLFQGTLASFTSVLGANLPQNVKVSAPNCLASEISVSISAGFSCTPTVATGSITFTFKNDSVNELPLGQVIGQVTLPIRAIANLVEGRFIKFKGDGTELAPAALSTTGWECTLDTSTGKLWEVRFDLSVTGGGLNRVVVGVAETSYLASKTQSFIAARKCGSAQWRRPLATELEQIRAKVVADLNAQVSNPAKEFTLGMALSSWFIFTAPPYGAGSPANPVCNLQSDGGGVWLISPSPTAVFITQCQASGPFATVLIAD